MLRKAPVVVFSVILLSVSSIKSYAHQPLEIAIPHFNPGFEMSIAALALKPGASNLNFVIYNKELPTQSPNWAEKNLRPGYSAAFEFGLGYRFTTGNDLKLNWTHLNSSDNASIAAPNYQYFLGPDYEIGPDAIPIRNAHGTAKFKYDVINLDAGQFVDFGQHVTIRFFGGLSTALLHEQVNTTYTGATTSGLFQGPFSTDQKVYANFTGIGPRFGMSARYQAHNGFGLLGEAAISALIGATSSKTSYLSSAQELLVTYNQTSNYQTIKDQNITQVIPGIDGKLGIDYNFTINKDTSLTVAAGYQAAVYINAISQYLPNSLVESMDTGGIFVATMDHSISNYSVQGPFLKATLTLS